jgi:hypothetical protein
LLWISLDFLHSHQKTLTSDRLVETNEVEDDGIREFVLDEVGHGGLATAGPSADANDVRSLEASNSGILLGSGTEESFGFDLDTVERSRDILE